MHGAVKFIGALIVIIKKSINQSACMNAEIERGRGGKSVFSPNKDLGTRVGDQLGTGKYFPKFCRHFTLPTVRPKKGSYTPAIHDCNQIQRIQTTGLGVLTWKPCLLRNLRNRKLTCDHFLESLHGMSINDTKNVKTKTAEMWEYPSFIYD